MRGERMFGEQGFVTREQIRERALARFDRLDANRDGTLTAAERQAGARAVAAAPAGAARPDRAERIQFRSGRGRSQGPPFFVLETLVHVRRADLISFSRSRRAQNVSHCARDHGVPGGDVVYYRLYRLSESDGRFVGFEEIEADDDVEAVRAAEAHFGPQPLELWCGKRRVKSFPAAGATGD